MRLLLNLNSSVVLQLTHRSAPLLNEISGLLVSPIGDPVSPPVSGFINGRHFTKVKVFAPIHKELPDKLKLENPTLGDMWIYCSYEKKSRVYRFLDMIDHEMENCSDHQCLSILLQRQLSDNSLDVAAILAPRKGLWITNPMLVPRNPECVVKTSVNNKRHLNRSRSLTRDHTNNLNATHAE